MDKQQYNLYDNDNEILLHTDISDKVYIKITRNFKPYDKIIKYNDNWVYNQLSHVCSLKDLGITLHAKELTAYWSNNSLINAIIRALVKQGIVNKDNYALINNLMFCIDQDIAKAISIRTNCNIVCDWHQVLYGIKTMNIGCQEKQVKTIHAQLEDIEYSKE